MAIAYALVALIGIYALSHPQIEYKKEVKVDESEEPAPSIPSFEGYPLLKKICTCESGLKQFNEDGTILRGRINPDDVGMCQINEQYHGTRDEILENTGLDIFTAEGNVAFAKGLFDSDGSVPWNWSKDCWDKETF